MEFIFYYTDTKRSIIILQKRTKTHAEREMQLVFSQYNVKNVMSAKQKNKLGAAHLLNRFSVELSDNPVQIISSDIGTLPKLSL